MRKYRLHSVLLFLLIGMLFGGCGDAMEAVGPGEAVVKRPIAAKDASDAVVLEKAEGTSEDFLQTPEASVSEGSEPEESESTEASTTVPETMEPSVAGTAEPSETNPSKSLPTKEIQLMMVGDNLMHMGIVNTGKQADGTYNYDILFEGIAGFLKEAELKMINQETILGGNEKGFSGYPHFNSPTQVGDAIVKAGFNVVLHASNHAADKKLEGLKYCLDYWRKYPDLTIAGIHEEGESSVQILTVEGIDFAILNYTYGPNTEVLSKDMEPYLDMLCNYDEQNRIQFTEIHPKVLEDIAEAEELADVVIVCPHWGREYTTEPSPYQIKFAKQMAEAGADVIIGTHPHVIQPVEWIEADNGNRALCYYSLGNYLSTQKQPLCMLEGMAWITFTVTEDGAVLCEESTGVIPLVCHYTAMPVRFQSVYLLEEYTQEQAAAHGIKQYGGVDLVLEDLQKWCTEVFGENVLSGDEVLQEQ